MAVVTRLVTFVDVEASLMPSRSRWAALAGGLRPQGVVVDARELRQLPHDVVLSERLLARIAS